MEVDLPVDGVAIGEDGSSLYGSHLTEALDEDEDSRRLFVLDTGVVTEDDKVPEDGDVWDFVGVKGSYDRI